MMEEFRNFWAIEAERKAKEEGREEGIKGIAFKLLQRGEKVQFVSELTGLRAWA